MNRRLDKLFEITVTRYLPMTRALTAEKIVSAYRRMLRGHFEEIPVHFSIACRLWSTCSSSTTVVGSGALITNLSEMECSCVAFNIKGVCAHISSAGQHFDERRVKEFMKWKAMHVATTAAAGEQVSMSADMIAAASMADETELCRDEFGEDLDARDGAQEDGGNSAEETRRDDGDGDGDGDDGEDFGGSEMASDGSGAEEEQELEHGGAEHEGGEEAEEQDEPGDAGDDIGCGRNHVLLCCV